MPVSTAATPETQRDALAAPVRDPVWMLARQWQTRGFVADDAGAPVHVRLSTSTAPLTAGGPAGNPVTAIEPVVEAEPLPSMDDLDHRSLVALASELTRRLRDEAAPVAGALAAAFPFAPTDPGPSIAPFVGRVPDPRPLQ